MQNITDESITYLWDDTLRLISQTYDNPKMNAFLKDLIPLELTSNQFILISEFQWPARIIMNDYKSEIESCLKEITFEDITLRVTVDPSRFEDKNEEPPQILDSIQTPKPQELITRGQPTSHQPREPQQQADYEVKGKLPTNASLKTFETLITGEPNRLAVTSAHRVAELPGQDSFNPFFIFGKSGTGKTHLLLAIRNHIAATQPHLKTLYITSEQFLNDYLRELRMEREIRSGAPIMQSYRNVDVLLVDDVQFLESKEESLNYFFNTFNHLKSQGKQIVLSADRAPKDMTMDERITSRFNEGLLAPINPPTIEMKTAIIKALYHNMTLNDPWYNIQIDESILFYMAELSSSNVREIEGFFTSVMVLADQMSSSGMQITKDDVKLLAEESFNLNYLRKVTILIIQKEIEKYFNISHDDMIGSSRKKNINFARQVAMFLSRELTDEPFQAIGDKFGRRDHTTIINGVKNIKERVENDRVFYDQIEQLKNRIRRLS